MVGNGYNLSDLNGDYIIKGKLISIDEDYVQGLWTGMLKLKMQIELTLVDAVTKEAIWKETIVANGMSKRTVSTKIALQTAFQDTLDNFLKQFTESDFIRKIK